tara:strand:+ start:108 stop:884 length:777 start_codon:yes stop_codon:yes gene_type:complete
MNLQAIHETECELFLRKWHYSPIMPRLTKIRLGYYDDKDLVGVITFGWGTRPLHTIKKLFPELETKDYYEIGKMAMHDKMPRNSESKMISDAIKWLKKNTDIKYLFTWADGMVGKAGYVYQASNFLYGGYSETDTYVTEDDERVHPRTIQGMMPKKEGIKVGARPNPEELAILKLTRVKGKQFRYIYPMAKKYRRYLSQSTVDWTIDYPKDIDLSWKVKKPKENLYVKTKKLPFHITKNVSFQKNKKKVQMSLFEYHA